MKTQGILLDFQNFFETAADSFVVVNEEGKIVLVNKQTERLFGYSSSELIGQFVEILMPKQFQLKHPLLRNKFLGHPHARMMNSGLNLYGLRKDGTEIPIDISLSPVNEKEKILTLAIIRDVTEQKKLRAEYDNFFNVSLDLLCIANTDGYFKRINPAFSRIFGYTEEELLKTPFISFVHKDDVEKTQQEVRKLSEGIPTIFFENHYRCKDGSYRLISWNATPINDVLYAIGRDITELRQFQEQKHEEESLRKATQMKSEFLANMSHELRTPLNSIIGFSEFMVDEKSGQLNAKQKEYLSDILNSGHHLLELINDILDLSKVEAGKMPLKLEDFSLFELIGEVSSVMTPSVKKKNLQLKINVSSDLGLVHLDSQKIKQILYNLLSNAVKFTDENGNIELAVSLLEKNKLQIQVKDTGIGIKKEDIGKLFGEFVQLDSGVDRRFQGTGLGLALTKKLVTLLQGTISVESIFGKGSTFKVILPVCL